MSKSATVNSRLGKLNKHFAQFVDVNKPKIPASFREGDLFLEALCAQSDPASCITRLISGGLPSLKACMHFRPTPVFFNGPANDLLKYLQHPILPSICGGDLLRQIVLVMVEPPIFWDAFVRAFRDGGLQEPVQQSFGWLLLHLIILPPEKATRYVELAREDSIQKRLLESQNQEVRIIGQRIKHIVSTVTVTATFDGYGGPGGRHDNDFVNFREIAIMPTADELSSREKPFLRLANAIEEAENDEKLAIHLDNQFRLLREELVADMREELQIALGVEKKKRHRGMVVENLKIYGFEFQKSGWGVKLQCQHDFGELSKLKDPKSRKKFFMNHPYIFKHDTVCCLLIDGEVVAFPTITRDRDLDLLASKPPIVTLLFKGKQSAARAILKLKTGTNIKIVQIDTAVFAFEPFLARLQQTNEVELEEELLSWKPTSGTQIGTTSAVPYTILDQIKQDPQKDLQMILGSKKSISLDTSQSESLIMGLEKRVSLIQGPPGTGKSFIGSILAKIIHDHTKKTILIVCFTNHALDQFLEDLMDIGIPNDHMVRLGAAARCTPRTKPLMLDTYNVRHARETKMAIDQLKAESGRLEAQLSQQLTEYLQCGITNDELLQHLEFLDDGPEWYAAFKVPDSENGYQFIGQRGRRVDEHYLLNQWRSGQDAGVFRSRVAPEHYHIWMMTKEERKLVNERWLIDILKERAEQLSELAAEYNESQLKMHKLERQKDAEALRSKRVIGCTTNAAASRFEAIRAANADVLLVEEAGEILESHILTALGPTTDQLILIGDHKQLRPKVNNYQLTVEKGEGYDLNRSLFERLVLKGFPHQVLTAQHRMRPEISALVRKLTYPDLTDAPRTQGRPDIRGLQHNVLFVSHSKPEDLNHRMGDSNVDGMTYKSSKQNTFEAEMVLKFVRYLAQQGYGTEHMVVLTPYLGQLSLLRDILSKDNDPVLSDVDSYDLVRAGLLPAASATLTKRPIKLSTIDNYQGEEADIVIASLTRSNSDHDIGFMAAPERLNVLLSRARNGLIMIGNPDTFIGSRKGHELWTRFFDHLKERGYIHEGLPVKCERHPDRTALLCKPQDFDDECPDGGCKEPCGTMLNCKQHQCPQRCHQLSDHSKMPCEHLMHTKCPAGHPQRWKCRQGIPIDCRQCERAVKEAEKQQKRDFERQQKKDEELKEHQRQIALLDDEIEKERQKLKEYRERRDRERALEQKKKDLRDAEKAVDNALRTPISTPKPSVSSGPAPVPTAPASTAPPTTSKPAGTNPTSNSSAPPPAAAASQPDPAKPKEAPYTAPEPSESEAEWQRQKDVENASNDAIDALMDMTGLENVKKQVLSIKAKIDTALRQNVDFKNERFGVVMLGNPGTGKTTVARLYAKFLNTYQGVLPGTEFFETTGSRLANDGVAGAKKAIEDILKEGGGAFFLDEAYQLTEKQSYGGAQVLDFLLAEIENNIGKIVFILAGYNKNMEKFFEHNPGIPSRIPYSLQFDDYKDHELHLMLSKMINKWYKGQMTIEDGMWGLYMRIAVRRLGRGRGRNGFGNARDLANIFAKIRERQGERLTRERRNGLIPDDFLFKKEDLIGPDPTEAVLESKAWNKLQSMIGLDSVKQSVQSMFDMIETNYKRELQEKPPMEVSLNRVFLGSPGTGKTTVAKHYGQILTDLGLLSNGEVVIKNPSDFVGSVLGESESNTKAILATTIGKVLIIDEAYMLFAGGEGGINKTNDPYKTAVIDTIVAEVQSTPGEDRCVLLLGYEDQMVTMFQNVNPGLQRRFALEDAFHFQDFTNAELRQILELKLKQQDLDATEEAKDVVCEMLGRARMKPNFGNGGEVENRLSDAKTRFQQRQSRKPPAERSIDVVFEPEDFDPNFARGTTAALNCRKLFEDVVGCEDIVAKLEGYQQTAVNAKADGIPLHELIPTNFVFKGPPGTGKTTTARKMGQVFYDMGFLSAAKVDECSASDLIGQYVGQTGPKTQKRLEKALGQVLFIDEAYRLTEGAFGVEAVNELVDILTKPKFIGKIVVILAGYENDINRLLQINPGLSSRFPEEVVFSNMSPEDCIKIFRHDIKAKKISADWLDSDVTAGYKALFEIVQKLASLNSWGNARDMKTVAKKMIGLVFTKPTGERGRILLEKDALDCAGNLLAEREARAGVLPTSTPGASGSSGPVQAPPPPDAPTAPAIATKRATRQAQPKKKEEPPKPAIKNVDGRDPNVSDGVWSQLQADKAAMQQRERQARAEIKKKEEEMRKQKALEEAKKKELEALERELAEQKAREDAELQELKRQLEAARLAEQLARLEREKILRELEAARERERQRRQQEAKAQERLRNMGVCVAGFQWIKQSGGYRCAGGSHFVSNAQLGM